MRPILNSYILVTQRLTSTKEPRKNTTNLQLKAHYISKKRESANLQQKPHSNQIHTTNPAYKTWPTPLLSFIRTNSKQLQSNQTLKSYPPAAKANQLNKQQQQNLSPIISLQAASLLPSDPPAHGQQFIHASTQLLQDKPVDKQPNIQSNDAGMNSSSKLWVIYFFNFIRCRPQKHASHDESRFKSWSLVATDFS